MNFRMIAVCYFLTKSIVIDVHPYNSVCKFSLIQLTFSHYCTDWLPKNLILLTLNDEGISEDGLVLAHVH